MRLGDALPASLVREYKDEIRARIEALEHRLRCRATTEEIGEVRRRCAGRVERYLDAGHGERLLRHKEVAKIVLRSLRMYDGERYALDAWCVMPNHAHVILTSAPGVDLEKVTYDWKHGSARLINQALSRRGRVWQNESFDHLPRDEANLERFRRYVIDNPAVAGLRIGSS